MRPPVIKTGDVYGRLTVISFHHKCKRFRRHYTCKCECGTIGVHNGILLRSGGVSSCGCLQADILRNNRHRALPEGESAKRSAIYSYRRRAKLKGMEYRLSNAEFTVLSQEPCHYCGDVKTNTSTTKGGKFYYNGLDRVDPSGGYTIDNVVACCRRCNLAKNNMSVGEFNEWVERVYTHLKMEEVEDGEQ
ncbi:MAG: HNH endonuclease [Candidatus Thorarchaeota archaeon]|jgi:hypothetical protein